MRSSPTLKNLARGGKDFHFHRIELVREAIEADAEVDEPLSDFLRDKLFRLPVGGLRILDFSSRDWPLCDRLLADRTRRTEERMLDLVAQYVVANVESVIRLFRYGDVISRRLLTQEAPVFEPEDDLLQPRDAKSLFGLRVDCASKQASTDELFAHLRKTLPPNWTRARLLYPLIFSFAHKPAASTLDTFLSYIVAGDEQEAEKLVIKLVLSDEAVRGTSLGFKTYVGLMGHPYDALDLALDHLEFMLAGAEPLPAHVSEFLSRMADALPDTRAADLHKLATSGVPSTNDGAQALANRFGLSEAETRRYVALCDIEPLSADLVEPEATRPFSILTNMRITPYPDPLQFQLVVGNHAVWSFVDGGRLVGALLRSIYMVERVERDLEARDVLRLMIYYGSASPFMTTAPTGLSLVQALAAKGLLGEDPASLEVRTDVALRRSIGADDRLWINRLQWRLRQLEDGGRIVEWLEHVRRETKLRPSFLTGINWQWVQEVLRLLRLKPFLNFDGAYLFVHMEMEAGGDPLRLRLSLDSVLRGQSFEDVVGTIISEFGTAAPAIVRRYLTTQNMLASGLAANYMAALDQRVRALEACIKALSFGPLLTEEVYESEVKALTAELLLTNVNAGKFEVPWELFRKDASDSQQDTYLAVASLRHRLEEEPAMTSIAETPVSFPNGRNQTYKVRRRDAPLFHLIVVLIETFMQHPAFGLEVILSGRFRHNTVLQELWSAVADTQAAVIVSVTPGVQQTLIEAYKEAAEDFIDEWCAARLQTRRPGKPEGLFDLVPEARDIEQLLASTREATGMLEIIDHVVEWIKSKLRVQVAAAREFFVEDVKAGLARKFHPILAEQLASNDFRPQDVHRVNKAVTDSVMRRVEELRVWFDGVDSASTDAVSLADLAIAAEALFENVANGRSLRVRTDDAAERTLLGPAEVKIAFDMLREAFYNAFRHGAGPVVDLELDRVEGRPGVVYAFRNRVDAASVRTSTREVLGSRYVGRDDALTREGNSGLAKIAASSATLIGHDTAVTCNCDGDRFELLVELATSCDEASA